MNKLLIVAVMVALLLLLSGTVHAGDFACFDADSTVTNQVVRWVASKGASYSSRIDCVRITREAYSTMNNRHKVVGLNVIPMTLAENELLDSIIVSNANAAEGLRIANYDQQVTAANVSDADLAEIDKEIDALTTIQLMRDYLKKMHRKWLND
jgi:hypothetical protein